MIFVTVGTNEAPFDRLVIAAGALVAEDEVFVQYGASGVRPPGATCVDFLSFEATVDAMQQARIVVTHAGVGSVMTALANGKRPFVVPRLKRFGEAVDDHQAEFAHAIVDVGLAIVVDDPSSLARVVSAEDQREAIELGPARRLVDDLRAYVEAVAGPPSAGAQRRETP